MHCGLEAAVTLAVLNILGYTSTTDKTDSGMPFVNKIPGCLICNAKTVIADIVDIFVVRADSDNVRNPTVNILINFFVQIIH